MFADDLLAGVIAVMLRMRDLVMKCAVAYDDDWGWKKSTTVRVARFRKVEPDVSYRHHDAIEFPDGSTVLVKQLRKGQRATVLQLPIGAQVPERSPKATTPAEAQAHETEAASAV